MQREPDSSPQAIQAARGSAREVFFTFLRLGVIAFGGPAAHIALFRQEFVSRRGWLTDSHFLDLLGATNIIPGPNSTEMAIHIGFTRAGWRGLIAGGIAFIFPAFVTVLALAVLYQTYGQTPAVAGIMAGIKPVVIAIIFQALIGLGRTALKTRVLMGVGAAVVLLNLLGVSELVLIFGAGAFMLALRMIERRAAPALVLLLPMAQAVEQVAVSLPVLFLTFLKIGAVLYGSGYVLIAFLQADFVDSLGWITQQQLLDAVAIGQFTPGPLFTTATFIGYLVAGTVGAVLATVAIFLPSFFFVAISNPIIPKIRNSPWLSAALDGVNAASLGVMASVLITLTRTTVIDVFSLVLTLAALIALLRFKINATWLILIGALLGLGMMILSPPIA
jgi:chromate transporter